MSQRYQHPQTEKSSKNHDLKDKAILTIEIMQFLTTIDKLPLIENATQNTLRQ